MVINIQEFTTEPRVRETSYAKELSRLAGLDPFAGLTFVYLRIQNYSRFAHEPGHMAIADPEAARAAFAGRPAVLVLDLAAEGVRYTDTFAHNLAAIMDALDLRPHQVVFVQTNANFAAALAASEAPAKVKAIRLAWFHLFLYDLAVDALATRAFELGHARIDAPGRPERLFLSLNATPRPTRVAAVAYIAAHPHRDRFWCTFHGLNSTKASLEKSANGAAGFVKHLGLSAATLVDLIRAHEFDPSAYDDDTVHTMVRALEPELYAKTRISVVTETEMTRESHKRFTEKSIKPLLMGHPMIVFGNRETLEQIETMGFDVLRDRIPGDYDRIEHPHMRFRRVTEIIDALIEADADCHASAEIRERLHRNVAMFEGELLERIQSWSTQSMLSATETLRQGGEAA